MNHKYLIFDSGSLINFSANSLLSVFEDLKKIFPGEFLITKTVKYEVIDHPIKVKRFEWGALRVQELLNKGVIKIAENNVVNENELKKEAGKILDIANNTFFVKNRALHLIDKGEAEALALSRILTRNKNQNTVVIDERTARVLYEKPEYLQRLMSKKLHKNVSAKKENFKEFSGINIIRSTELAYIAYKKGFIHIKDKKTLEAVTYALKFNGVSISEKEVQMYKRFG